MSGYQRHVLEGAVAGLATGLLLSIVTALVLAPSVTPLVEDLVRHQLSGLLPPEEVDEAVKAAVEIAGTALLVAPVIQPIQYALLGALFGLVRGALRIKLGLGAASSALAAGGLFTLSLGVAPIVALSALQPWMVEVISRYLNLYLAAVAPGAVFTAALIAVGLARGPWARLAEARPKEV